MSALVRGSALPSRQALAGLQAALQMAGWTLLYIDVDLAGESPVFDARVERSDGLWLHARMDPLGRCTLERNRRLRWLGMPRDVRGRVPQTQQVRDEFLGRESFVGPRSLARHLSDYIAHNSTGLGIEQMRNAWRPVLTFGATTGDRSDG